MYVILNFKTYTESSGDNALRLAEAVAQIEVPANLDFVICPQAADIFRIREQFPEITVWSQHVDPIDSGKNTGWTSAATIIMAGANGTLVNHSEHPLTTEQIDRVLAITRHYQLTSCLAVPDIESALELASTEPDMFAFEPPELISTGKSLVDVNPQSAAEFVEKMRPTQAKLILGAGVADRRDLQESAKLGYAGVLLASAFVKSEHPQDFLRSLIS